MAKKTETTETVPTGSKAEQLRNILNATMKSDIGHLANEEVYKNGFWSTTFLPIDVALGGGWAKGRHGLCYGEEATLKTLVGLGTVAGVQKEGGMAAYFDLEKAFNPDWAERLGIDLSQLIISRPKTGEEAMDAVEVLVRQNIDFICVDSIAALLPKSEQELQLSGKDHNQPARIASLLALAFRKITAANEKTSILWISQMRDNLGAMAFSPKSVVTGGKSKNYYTSQQLMNKKIGKVYNTINYYDGEKDQTGKQIVGQNFMVEQTKTRFGQPFTQSYFLYDTVGGYIDNIGYMIQQGLDDGIITRAGAWWTYTDINAETGEVGQEYKAGSKDKFYDLVAGNEEVKTKLLNRVCAKYGLDPTNYDI